MGFASIGNGLTQFANMIMSQLPQEPLAERLARKKIYHPEEFDKEIKDVEQGRVPTLNFKPRNAPAGKPALAVTGHQGFVESYNKAFKSKTYQDAMKNYELRQRFPERYVPAGFESLQNLDMYAMRGAALQKRGLLGRRRSQSLGAEQAPQEAGL